MGILENITSYATSNYVNSGNYRQLYVNNDRGNLSTNTGIAALGAGLLANETGDNTFCNIASFLGGVSALTNQQEYSYTEGSWFNAGQSEAYYQQQSAWTPTFGGWGWGGCF